VCIQGLGHFSPQPPPPPLPPTLPLPLTPHPLNVDVLYLPVTGKVPESTRDRPPINWIYYSYQFEGNMSKVLSSLKYYCNGCNKPGSSWPRKDRKVQKEVLGNLRWVHKCGHSNCFVTLEFQLRDDLLFQVSPRLVGAVPAAGQEAVWFVLLVEALGEFCS
jgi:hypothetical protein